MKLDSLPPELLTSLPVDRRAVEILRAVTEGAGYDRLEFVAAPNRSEPEIVLTRSQRPVYRACLERTRVGLTA